MRTETLSLPRDEWFDNVKYPYVPFERNYEQHAAKIRQRHDFSPNHPTLGMACHLVTVTENGKTYKVNGMTTTYMALKGDVSYPPVVRGVHYYVDTMEQARQIYDGIDNPMSPKGSQDRLVSAFKSCGVGVVSLTLCRGSGTSGLAIAYNAIVGKGRTNSPPSNMTDLVFALRPEIRALDILLDMGENARAKAMVASSPIIAAAIITRRKSVGPLAERWVRFWTDFVQAKGEGATQDPAVWAWNEVKRHLAKSGGGREHSLNATEAAIYAWEQAVIEEKPISKLPRVSEIKLDTYFNR